MKLSDFTLSLGAQEFAPLMIGGMGVDISTADLALEACKASAIGHISDAMVPFVADKNFGTHFVRDKAKRFSAYRHSLDKNGICFDLSELRAAQMLHVEKVMNRKKGAGAVFINIMEKLSMTNPTETLKTRLLAALDAGIDGITLSAGLHMGSFKMMESHPRFREAKLGIIVSSARALKIFLRSAGKSDRMPDYIVLEGPLAGGHLGFGMDWADYSLSSLLNDLLELLKKEELDIPVIAAGGVFSGGDAVQLMQMGASAVQVATRFTVTEECGLPEHVKQEYFRASEDDVVVNSVSPTGYPMRMLSYSPCLSSNVRPSCEAFGFMLSTEGKCQYIDAYRDTPLAANGKKENVKDKICLCHHFSKYNCYTCGHYVFRLKDTTVRNEDGSYQLLTASHVLKDYLYSEDAEILLPSSAAAIHNQACQLTL